MDKKFNFKKKFGQNFLKDESIVEKIVLNANIEKDSLVVEVGPGQGILSKMLSKYSKQVLCYEIDMELEDYLARELKKYDNILVLYKDFLEVDIKKDIERFDYSNLYFVSNVPYYITTPILMKLIESNLAFSNIVMMVQKEVADRFCSRPGKKDYNSITVFLNYYYDLKKVLYVPRKEFTPEPNVDSEVISLIPKKHKLEVKDENLFFELVRKSFQFKRKTIKNNLKNYNLETIDLILHEYGYDLSVRAEALDVEVFAAISNALCNNYNKSK